MLGDKFSPVYENTFCKFRKVVEGCTSNHYHVMTAINPTNAIHDNKNAPKPINVDILVPPHKI